MKPISRSRVDQVIGLVILLASVFAIFQSFRVSDAQRNYVTCQAGWSEQLAQVLSARNVAGADDRATDRLEITAIRKESGAVTRIFVAAIAAGDQGLSDAQRDELLADYQATIDEVREAYETVTKRRAQVEQARERHPLPNPPSQICGRP